MYLLTEALQAALEFACVALCMIYWANSKKSLRCFFCGLTLGLDCFHECINLCSEVDLFRTAASADFVNVQGFDTISRSFIFDHWAVASDSPILSTWSEAGQISLSDIQPCKCGDVCDRVATRAGGEVVRSKLCLMRCSCN